MKPKTNSNIGGNDCCSEQVKRSNVNLFMNVECFLQMV